MLVLAVLFLRRHLTTLRTLFVLLVGFPITYVAILLVLSLVADAIWGHTRFVC